MSTTNKYLLPPVWAEAGHETEVNGRKYNAPTNGTALTVPDFDANILAANGWVIIDPAAAAYIASQASGGSGGFTQTNITPTGTMNGVNKTFTLPSAPAAGKLLLWYNGLLLTGGGADYTLTGSTIVFLTITPNAASDTLLASY